ncbi:MAG: hypothetical protein LBG27_00645, partial [Spirochaetaceae bacterium]|nr:hypothetical protein [Spirochaetaceae bacterium]
MKINLAPAAVKQNAAARAEPRRDGEQEYGASRLIIAPGPYFIVRSGNTAVEKGRYAGIDLGKRTRETAVITRTGKADALGDLEPEEKRVFYQGKTPPEGRLKLYGKLKTGDKACLEAEKAAGCRARALNARHLPVICAAGKEDALKLA